MGAEAGVAAVDVVIIGAGIIGAAAAWVLADAGLAVTVLEAGPVNRGGTGTTAGNLHIQTIHPERPGAVAADVARLAPLQRAASDLWREAEDCLGVGLGVHRTGGLTVAETDHEVRLLEHNQSISRRIGVPTDLLRGKELRDFAPELGPSVLAANWCPWDGYANPLRATVTFLRAAVECGAQVAAFRRVLALERHRRGWLVSTRAGSLTARVVVNASGAELRPVAQLAGADLDTDSAELQMHLTTRSAVVLPRLIQHVAHGLSAKQLQTGQVLIGGGWPAEGRLLPGTRGRDKLSSVIGNLDLACRIVPRLASLSLLRVWTGPMLATPDEMPVIGEVPNCPGLYVCGGPYSFTLAPLWAQVLRCMVLGSATPVAVDDLGPRRLHRNEDGRAG